MTDVLAYLESKEPSKFAEAPEQEFDSVRFQIQKNILLALLDKVSLVVPVKADNLALKNFYVQVGDVLKITGHDGFHSLIVSTKLFEPVARGSMMLPAKMLTEILRSVPDVLVDIEFINGTIIVVAGGASWELRALSGLAYPNVLPKVPGTPPAEVDRTAFLEALSTVKYAVARDVARPGLKMIDIRHNKMTACDGNRFQRAPINCPPMQIGRESVDLIQRVLESSTSPNFLLGEADNKLVFKVDKTLLLVTKPTAKFPHAEQLFLRPALNNDQELIVSKDELVSAIKHVRLCADEDTSAIALKLTKDKIEVSTRDEVGNKSKEVISATWKGKSRTLTVHHKYLLEALAVHNQDECKFMLGEDAQSRKSPLLLMDADSGKVGVVQQMYLGSLAGYTL